MSKNDWKTVPQIASSEITPESVWLNRRSLMKATTVGAGLAAIGEASAGPKVLENLNFDSAPDGTPFKATEDLTPYEVATTYNNFYEFGTDKSDPARYADAMTTDPWEIKVGGLVNKPGKLHLEDILGGFDLEERVYRFRCRSCSSGLSRKQKENLLSSKRFIVVQRCEERARSPRSLTGRIGRVCEWMRLCTH